MLLMYSSRAADSRKVKSDAAGAFEQKQRITALEKEVSQLMQAHGGETTLDQHRHPGLDPKPLRTQLHVSGEIEKENTYTYVRQYHTPDLEMS
jgi:eRF1 domain 1